MHKSFAWEAFCADVFCLERPSGRRNKPLFDVESSGLCAARVAPRLSSCLALRGERACVGLVWEGPTSAARVGSRPLRCLVFCAAGSSSLRYAAQARQTE
jgi:hypothetical protein